MIDIPNGNIIINKEGGVFGVGDPTGRRTRPPHQADDHPPIRIRWTPFRTPHDRRRSNRVNPRRRTQQTPISV